MTRENIFEGRTYSAKFGKVHVDPLETKNSNGTRTISLGFSLCEISEHVNDRDAVADQIAKLLNAAATSSPATPVGEGARRADEGVAAQ